MFILIIGNVHTRVMIVINKMTMKPYYRLEIVRNFCNHKQFMALSNLDTKFIGTENYMGFAYFWDHGLKWYLRPATAWQRVKVHGLFVCNDIPLIKSDDGKEKYFPTTKLAEEITRSVCKY